MQCIDCIPSLFQSDICNRNSFLACLCIFFCFLSFVRKKYSNFGVDKLASCIRMLSLNASMPRYVEWTTGRFSTLEAVYIL